MSEQSSKPSEEANLLHGVPATHHRRPSNQEEDEETKVPALSLGPVTLPRVRPSQNSRKENRVNGQLVMRQGTLTPEEKSSRAPLEEKKTGFWRKDSDYEIISGLIGYLQDPRDLGREAHA